MKTYQYKVPSVPQNLMSSYEGLVKEAFWMQALKLVGTLVALATAYKVGGNAIKYYAPNAKPPSIPVLTTQPATPIDQYKDGGNNRLLYAGIGGLTGATLGGLYSSLSRGREDSSSGSVVPPVILGALLGSGIGALVP